MFAHWEVITVLSYTTFTFIQLKLCIVPPALASWGIHVHVGSHLTCLPYNPKKKIGCHSTAIGFQWHYVFIWNVLWLHTILALSDSPFAAMAPSKKPFETVSRGQLVSRGLMGGGGCSSCALGSTSGTYKTQDPPPLKKRENSYTTLTACYCCHMHEGKSNVFSTHRLLFWVKGLLQCLSFFIQPMSGCSQVSQRLWKHNKQTV